MENWRLNLHGLKYLHFCRIVGVLFLASTPVRGRRENLLTCIRCVHVHKIYSRVYAQLDVWSPYIG